MQLRLIIPALAVIAGLALNQFYPTLVSFLAFAAGTVMKSIGLSYNDGREHRCLEYVKLNAVQGNASDVLFQIDKFGWNEAFLMNVGDAKGEILSKALMEKSPAHVLEIGAYVGYSATRIASGLGERGHVTSVEFSKRNAAIARQMVEYAGLSDKVDFVEGTVTTVLKEHMKKNGIDQFDFVFIDHEKSLYLPDLKYLLDEHMIAAGAVIVGDNILFPGAPDYRVFVNTDPRFRTVEHTSHVEYLPIPDVVTVSVFVGGK